MNRKLLLADDSVTIQRVVELTFSGENIDVVAVSDGEQAIARISADPPDIVLADIAMPKKNGYEVAAFVKEHATLSQVPVLLLAGAFEPVDEERARRVKCDGVLVKPFETHEVIARVRELLDGKHLQPAQAAPVGAAPPPVSAPIRDVVETTKTTAPDESVDDYFDRLDVAFATRTQTPPRPFPHLTPPTPEPPNTSAPPSPPGSTGFGEAGMLASSGPAGETEPRNVIADLFKLFLEVEQGERDASSIQIPEEIDRIRRRNTIE